MRNDAFLEEKGEWCPRRGRIRKKGITMRYGNIERENCVGGTSSIKWSESVENCNEREDILN